jgi:hypothetical protein
MGPLQVGDLVLKTNADEEGRVVYVEGTRVIVARAADGKRWPLQKASNFYRLDDAAVRPPDKRAEDKDEAGARAAATDAAAAADAAVQAAADASKAAPKRKLPSALDALSTGGTKPSFLQGGKDSEFEVVELKERRLAPPVLEDRPPPLAPQLKKTRDASTAQVRTNNTCKLAAAAHASSAAAAVS